MIPISPSPKLSMVSSVEGMSARSPPPPKRAFAAFWALSASSLPWTMLVSSQARISLDQKVTDIDQKYGCELFLGDGVIIKKGKKVFHRAFMS